MPITYQILVSNKSSVATGEIVDIYRGDVELKPSETMQAFIKSGGDIEDWSRVFSLVVGTDGSYEEMRYLNVYKEDGVTKKYYFKQPSRDSLEFKELYQSGETHQTTEKILSFIGVR